jgi:hypothetical protein
MRASRVVAEGSLNTVPAAQRSKIETRNAERRPSPRLAAPVPGSCQAARRRPAAARDPRCELVDQEPDRDLTTKDVLDIIVIADGEEREWTNMRWAEGIGQVACDLDAVLNVSSWRPTREHPAVMQRRAYPQRDQLTGSEAETPDRVEAGGQPGIVHGCRMLQATAIPLEVTCAVDLSRSRRLWSP